MDLFPGAYNRIPVGLDKMKGYNIYETSRRLPVIMMSSLLPRHLSSGSSLSTVLGAAAT